LEKKKMAIARRFSLGAFLAGIAVAILVAIGAGLAIILGGLYPVAASSHHSPPVRWAITEAREHGVERSAAGLSVPRFTAADIREGGSHFKGMCQACHGGPGAEPEEFAAGMNPRPPDLARAAGDLSVEQVFWIAKNGLRMTGMPAFGKTDDDEELWKVAAFVKQLPKVTASEYGALPNAHEAEGHEATEAHHHHH
jgi:mono/diheme cytochrome c family protein